MSAAKPRTQSNVRKQRQQTTEQIKETNRKIKQNTKETARQLNQLNLLSARLRETNQDINVKQKSLDSINAAVRGLSDSIKVLDRRLANMRQKYATAVKKMHGNRNAVNRVAFMFASKSVAQAYRRMRYLEQYSRWRQRKTEEIAEVVKSLDEKRAALDEKRKIQAQAVSQLADARAELGRQRTATDKLVAGLKKEGKSLQALLKAKEKEARRLDAELEKIIAEEQRRAEAEQRKKKEAEERRQREEAERQRKAKAEVDQREKDKVDKKEQKTQSKQQKESTKGADKNKKGASTAPTATSQTSKNAPATKSAPTDKDYESLSGSFEQNKGRLPYPVAGRYTVVRTFGRTTHPDLPHVQVDNAGIDIEVSPGTAVRAVFAGKVSEIFKLPGFETIVMIRHGRYLTIYANVEGITVKKGDSVTAGMTLGRVYSDPTDNNRSILHFEIREERQKLNPQLWLK
jgi:septal ring factor EnvC (AmiA/AmiB activator)